MRVVLLIAMVTVAAGCGAGSSGGRPPASEAGPRDRPAPPPASPQPLGQVECGRLLDHFLDLQMDELRARLPPEEIPTEAQVADIRRAKRQDGMQGCVGAARAPFDCAMAARSTAAVRSCLGPPSAGSAPPPASGAQPPV